MLRKQVHRDEFTLPDLSFFQTFEYIVWQNNATLE